MKMFILLASLYCVVYALFVVALPYFFTGLFGNIQKVRWQSIGTILVFCMLTFGGSFLIPDPFWANRFLHGMGGGLVAFVLYALAVQDGDARLTRFQFFVLGVLLATALGVANELLEMILQTVGLGVYAHTVTDTWFDLASNTVGIAVAGTLATIYRTQHILLPKAQN